MTGTRLKFIFGMSAAVVFAAGTRTLVVAQTVSNGKPTTQEIVKRSQAVYDALTNYSDTGKVVCESMGQTTTTSFKIRLQRPNLYRIGWTQPTDFFTNTGSVWCAGSGDYLLMGMAGQGKTPTPQKMQDKESALAGATGISSMAASSIPGTFFNQNWGSVLKAPVSGATRLKKENDEKVGDVDCDVIVSTIGPQSPDTSKSADKSVTTLWIGKQDHIIHQIKTIMESGSITVPKFSDADIKAMLESQNKPATPDAIAASRAEMEEAMKQAQAAMNSGKIVFTETHENISVTNNFSAADFAQ